MLDTQHQVEAPEGIFLSVRPAGFTSRAKAFLIDFGLRIGILLAALPLLNAAGHLGQGMLMVVAFALEWLYPVCFELMAGGATPGKRAAGLRVVMDDGLPVTLAASVTRNLLRVADFLPLMYAFGLLTLLWRADFKRLGDLAAGTLVVHDDRFALHTALPAAEPRAPARALSTREQAAILGWAARVRTLTPERAEELARLARPAYAPPAAPMGAQDATVQLLGVAQWLSGSRPAPQGSPPR